jgi:Asp-tRNA(Asn)/Glu-tRNA(Gln) amidotransferase A subunit family amidase
MLTRRQWYKSLAGIGIGSATFQRALAAQAGAGQTQPEKTATNVTPEMIQQAEWISGITLTEAERKRLATEMNRQLGAFQSLRRVKLPNSVPPALVFHTADNHQSAANHAANGVTIATSAPDHKPSSDEELAFSSVASLGHLIRSKQISSLELTKVYLDRLKKYGPALLCIVSLTEELAMKQAEHADKEIAAGRYRGPLHGIPWGAKDLISYPGYKTTWGAGPYKEQTLETKATVASRLEEAGAVLVAKLTLGALAQGDQWFGGMTRNPWNIQQGSSGSSAGSAAATVAGLVGFAIGTETLGSIVSPCTRCGATGLRPTFGRISRYGCMALAWSMDKLGPIARSVEDCALIFNAIHGHDPQDPSSVDRPFQWPATKKLKEIKVGYVESNVPKKERKELTQLEELGVQLVAIKLPDNVPVVPLRLILTAEAGAAFDDLTRAGIKEGMGTWPGTFQSAEFIPAVEYIRANRIRTMLMEAMQKVFEHVDLYVGGNDLIITNFTGHPTVVMPNGFRKSGEVEVPTAITMTGNLFDEGELMTVAHAYQLATKHHLKHPPMEKVSVEERERKDAESKKSEEAKKAAEKKENNKEK